MELAKSKIQELPESSRNSAQKLMRSIEALKLTGDSDLN